MGTEKRQEQDQRWPCRWLFILSEERRGWWLQGNAGPGQVSGQLSFEVGRELAEFMDWGGTAAG